MLGLTRKTDYALVALAYLGQRRAAGEEAASARRIADQFKLPLPLLMNVLKDLAHAKLVTSTRGQAGGYALASDPEHVTVLEVITAMEGPARLTQCADDLTVLGQECRVCGCGIKGPIRRLHHRIQSFLGEVTLADLMRPGVDFPSGRVTVNQLDVQLNV
jgi:Rrf2 family protein